LLADANSGRQGAIADQKSPGAWKITRHLRDALEDIQQHAKSLKEA
jgi:hypothetical protein